GGGGGGGAGRGGGRGGRGGGSLGGGGGRGGGGDGHGGGGAGGRRGGRARQDGGAGRCRGTQRGSAHGWLSPWWFRPPGDPAGRVTDRAERRGSDGAGCKERAKSRRRGTCGADAAVESGPPRARSPRHPYVRVALVARTGRWCGEGTRGAAPGQPAAAAVVLRRRS